MSKRFSWELDEGGFPVNPQTLNRFKYGDLREDGAKFNAYRVVKGKLYPHFIFAVPTHQSGPKRTIGTVVHALFKNAKQRAIVKGVRFDLTLEWVREQVQKEFLRGEVILASQGTGKRNPRAPSIDRIVPSLGYVKSNCRILPLQLNCARGDWDDDSFLDILGPEVDRLRAKRQRSDMSNATSM